MSTKNRGMIDGVMNSTLNMHDYIGVACLITLALLLARVTYDLYILHGGYTTLAIVATIFLSLYVLTEDQ